MNFDFVTLANFHALFSILYSIGLSLIGITSIVVFHEFGHFVFCKLFHVYTPTFSIGIGKKILRKTIGDTEFCLSAGPLGGYVEIATEATDGKKGFYNINYLQKVFIMLGGIACNMIFAYIIFSILFFVGMPDSPFMPYENTTPTVHSITETSINYHILQPGDIITSIAQRNIEGKSEIIKEHTNKAIAKNAVKIDAIILHNGIEQEITLNLNADQKPMPLEQRLEISFNRKAPLTLTASIAHGITLTHFYIKAIFASLKGIFSAKNSQALAGPIMTLASSTKVAQKGLKSLLIFLAIISINLGIMNLLPLPIFDGGQFVIFTIEAILGKEMSDNVKEKIGSFSWFLVLGLMVIFSIKDIYLLLQQYIL